MRHLLLLFAFLAPAGCVSTPDTYLTAQPQSDWHPLASDRLAVLAMESEEAEAPPCAAEVLRRHLPEGPVLDPAIFADAIKKWLAENPKHLPREVLRQAALSLGRPEAVPSANVPYLAVLRGRSDHEDERGTMEGADVIVVFKIPHVTIVNVDIFDLEQGLLLHKIKVSSRGNRYYGIAGVFPIIGYSDTAGSACVALEDSLVGLLAEPSS